MSDLEHSFSRPCTFRLSHCENGLRTHTYKQHISHHSHNKAQVAHCNQPKREFVGVTTPSLTIREATTAQQPQKQAQI
jgi:hypothetical protein